MEHLDERIAKVEQQLIVILTTLAELKKDITHIRESQDSASEVHRTHEARIRLLEEVVRDAQSKVRLLLWLGSALGIGGAFQVVQYLSK